MKPTNFQNNNFKMYLSHITIYSSPQFHYNKKIERESKTIKVVVELHPLANYPPTNLSIDIYTNPRHNYS